MIGAYTKGSAIAIIVADRIDIFLQRTYLGSKSRLLPTLSCKSSSLPYMKLRD
jgi:hypothetical protein